MWALTGSLSIALQHAPHRSFHQASLAYRIPANCVKYPPYSKTSEVCGSVSIGHLVCLKPSLNPKIGFPEELKHSSSTLLCRPIFARLKALDNRAVRLNSIYMLCVDPALLRPTSQAGLPWFMYKWLCRTLQDRRSGSQDPGDDSYSKQILRTVRPSLLRFAVTGLTILLFRA